MLQKKRETEKYSIQGVSKWLEINFGVNSL
jgi:hypothetical protein